MTNRAPSGSLFTFRMIPLVSNVLASRGVDGRALLSEAGLPAEALRGEITAPLSRIQRFIELAARRLDNPMLGLELSQLAPTGTYGVAEFLMRSAPTIEHSMKALCEFAPLINPIGDFRFVVTAEGGELHYTVLAHRDTLGPLLNEYTLGVIVRQFGLVLNERLPLARAWFSHSAPRHAEVLAKHFATAVAYGSPDCGVALTRAVLNRQLRTADQPLFDFLLSQARALLSSVGTHDVVSQVIRVIEVRFPNGDVSTQAIASAMATTVRSLQRRLAEAGTSFRDVLAHVRNRRRAELTRGNLSETEIAYRLGFADARSMRRSLDRTTDV